MQKTSGYPLHGVADEQRREWRFQRAGLVVLALVVAAALAGAFGHGPLSWHDVSSSSGALSVSGPRFARSGGEATLTIHAGPSLATDEAYEVRVESAYADALGFGQVRPEPASVQADGDHLVYVIERRDPDAPLDMTIDLSPRGLWRASGRIDVGGEAVGLGHFVYP